jgi:hypothetical protein
MLYFLNICGFVQALQLWLSMQGGPIAPCPVSSHAELRGLQWGQARRPLPLQLLVVRWRAPDRASSAAAFVMKWLVLPACSMQGAGLLLNFEPTAELLDTLSAELTHQLTVRRYRAWRTLLSAALLDGCKACCCTHEFRIHE